MLHPCNEEFLQTEIQYYFDWVKERLGVKYLPKVWEISYKFAEQ